MKKALALLLSCFLLTGCGNPGTPSQTLSQKETTGSHLEASLPVQTSEKASPYSSRFESETVVLLSDQGITVNARPETDAVYTSQDIIYYEDRDTYDSGNPYGEGKANEKHTVQEAAAHTVVNITEPGTYRVSGKLSAGQLRIDLGEDACDNPDAVVELILENADITCSVAPAILFLNVYECDGNWSTENAQPNVDTTYAGANLILEQENTITGSHVAKIFKDKDGEKKLWKQDGAIYSYMSMNIFGPGELTLYADNEGLGTELHLTIHGGSIRIDSNNDGINTNEDGVSVTTIHDGSLWINAGLGEEGDGIDSNGYLVINGGTVVSAAKPASDAGLDSDLGSYIHGGTVIALGSAMDWAESDSGQVAMNLQFSQEQQPGTNLVVTDSEGNLVFAYTPEVIDGLTRGYRGVILSSPKLQQKQTYHVYTGGTLEGGSAQNWLTDVSTVTGYTGGTQQQYTGSDVGFGGPGRGGFGGEHPDLPEDFDPKNFDPGDFIPPEDMTFPKREAPEGSFEGRNPDAQPPDRFSDQLPPEEMELPEIPAGERPQGDIPNRNSVTQGPSTEFFMADKVNAFSGISPT